MQAADPESRLVNIGTLICRIKICAPFIVEP